MKILKDIVWVILTLLLIGITANMFHNNLLLKEENDRLSDNMEQYGRKLSTLELTKKELKQELEKRNKTIVAADSILQSRNMKISQLERLVATRIVIVDKDTTFPIPEKAVPVFLPTPSITSQLYKSVFKTATNCISIEGFILSTDPDPSIAITHKSVKVDVYNIDVKRRWWQFWKPRSEKIVSSECGDVFINEIEKIK